jgi:ABC-type polysaccharide/polyol phosphate export permease
MTSIAPNHQDSPTVTLTGSRSGLRPFFKKLLRDLSYFRFAYINFVVNGIRVRYRRSNLGFFWTLLNPLMTMTIMALAFSYVFKQNIREYAVFLFSGLIPYNFLSASITESTKSIANGEAFLKKIYTPKFLFPLVTVSIEAVNFFLTLTALFILALILGAQIHSSLLLLPFALGMMFFFSLGVGLVLAVTYVYFRDISHFVQVIFTALFYLTPVLYPVSAIPPQLSTLFLLNPLTYFVKLVRILILGLPFTARDWGIPLLLAITSFLIGLMVLYRKDKDIIFRL